MLRNCGPTFTRLFNDSVECMAITEFLRTAVRRFLGERSRPPRLIGLGEPMHGVDAFLDLRNELLRALVEEHGCRWVALESDCLAGRLVDDHVLGGDGDLDRVMTDGFSHGFGASAGNRALVEWLRVHNRGRSPGDRVRFAGVDPPMEAEGAQSPRAALRLLHTYLTESGTPVPYDWGRIDALLGDDERWSDPAVIMDPAKAVGATPEARELRVIADDLGWLLTAEGPLPGSAALRDAELAARTASGLLAYHATLARTERYDRWAHCTGIRDAMMADNLRALAPGPVLAFAHHQHLRRGPGHIRAADRDWRFGPAGAHLARTFGADYAVIATAVGAAPHLGIPDPPPNTLEGHLSATTTAPRLVSTADLAAVVPGLVTRPAGSHRAYIPLDPATLDDFDAVLFVPHLDPPDAAARG